MRLTRIEVGEVGERLIEQEEIASRGSMLTASPSSTTRSASSGRFAAPRARA